MTTSQAFVYKAGHAPELHDKDVADRMKAEEGWTDSAANAKNPPKAKVENDASDAPYNPDRHYKDGRKDEAGNWAVRKSAK